MVGWNPYKALIFRLTIWVRSVGFCNTYNLSKLLHTSLKLEINSCSSVRVLIPMSFTVWLGECSVVSDSLWPHGLKPTRLLCPWKFPGKHTGVGCHFIFPIQYNWSLFLLIAYQFPSAKRQSFYFLWADNSLWSWRVFYVCNNQRTGPLLGTCLQYNMKCLAGVDVKLYIYEDYFSVEIQRGKCEKISKNESVTRVDLFPCMFCPFSYIPNVLWFHLFMKNGQKS